MGSLDKNVKIFVI